jgi:hypothetical protein
MIFVQGESSIVAKAKITSTFQSLLPNEDMAREYLNEASRDLNRLKQQLLESVRIIRKDVPNQLYDFDSIASIEKCIKSLFTQLQPLPRKTNKEILISWSIQLTALASIILVAMWMIN